MRGTWISVLRSDYPMPVFSQEVVANLCAAIELLLRIPFPAVRSHPCDSYLIGISSARATVLALSSSLGLNRSELLSAKICQRRSSKHYDDHDDHDY